MYTTCIKIHIHINIYMGKQHIPTHVTPHPPTLITPYIPIM